MFKTRLAEKRLNYKYRKDEYITRGREEGERKKENQKKDRKRIKND